MIKQSPIDAESIVSKVAEMLRSVRKQQQLTLDDLAQRSGVSRSMLSQIERGESNPTLATLWNLTQALGVDFAGLLGSEPAAEPSSGQVERLPAQRTPTIDSRGERCRLRILSPPDLAGKVEWYELQLEAGGALVSDAHAPGSMEHLTVLEGRIGVQSGLREEEGGAGDTLRYRADVAHRIAALAGEPAKALLIVLTD
ncbi:helix-turn-helix domain-containing protein [Pelagibius litoralis]|uniref:Helix-turn-helix domain-containing protein n=1 Tax=Pelagibius litoralis TaxID=374515 RepID=A0A967C1L9_9PROT|nr:XRE family transcriptional regulator [Pelagibius litoralis]NIA67426.1 helix-turn-helix domain-containing protein [Pelagibius litoralis]